MIIDKMFKLRCEIDTDEVNWYGIKQTEQKKNASEKHLKGWLVVHCEAKLSMHENMKENLATVKWAPQQSAGISLVFYK